MKKKTLIQAPSVPLRETPFTSRMYVAGKPLGQPAHPQANVAYVQTRHPHANIPELDCEESVCYNLDLVERCDGQTEDMVNNVTLFDTGIVIKPPEGFYFEIIPSPQLYKSGYMMASSIEVIEPNYRGNIMVPLLKFKDADDLKTPVIGAVKLLARKANYIYMGRADEDIAEEEPRNNSHLEFRGIEGGAPGFSSGSRGDKQKEKIRQNQSSLSSKAVRAAPNRSGKGGSSMFS